MRKTNHLSYVKRTQKGYSISFKLGVVQEIERGELSINGSANMEYSRSTVLNWLRKFGTFYLGESNTIKYAQKPGTKNFRT